MTRTPTPVDELADAFVARFAALDPLAATAIGVKGHDHEMTDFSPAGNAARAELARETLSALDRIAPQDATDEVTIETLRYEIGSEVELDEAGELLSQLNNIDSPLQAMRDAFDLMATDTDEDWAIVAERMRALPAAARGYVEALNAAADAGHIVAVRQFEEGVRQAAELADPSSSFFAALAAGGPEARRAELEEAAAGAIAAYGELAEALRELAPRGAQADAFGRERYAMWSRAFIGAAVDLDETYAWGLEQLAEITAEQTAIARRIAGPGASVEDAIRLLDSDPARKLHGTDALQRWMQQTSDAAIAALNGTHFEIPEPIQRLECRIAPTQTGGIYYTGPSDDLTRPGRMWWSVPAGVEEFGTWRELTTVYHEGVPGHHLQIATAVINREELNSYRRLLAGTSGHAEGWALYAERLMADLGFLDDDGDRLGMLDGQRMRAARVVFDIGVHLGLPAPEEFGGGTWDADKGWELLNANIHMAEAFNRFEWLRYLGWAGQAPSYLVGQRLWRQIRDAKAAEAAARGEVFDAPAFHTRALKLGAIPLDVLAKGV